MGLLRDSGAPQRMVAIGGQYQQSLPQARPTSCCACGSTARGLVPEITGHRLMVSIRMMRADAEGRLRPAGATPPSS
jgi:cell division protein ZapD